MKNKHKAALELAAKYIEEISGPDCENCPLHIGIACIAKFPDIENCAPAIVAYFLKEAEEKK